MKKILLDKERALELARDGFSNEVIEEILIRDGKIKYINENKPLGKIVSTAIVNLKNAKKVLTKTEDTILFEMKYIGNQYDKELREQSIRTILKTYTESMLQLNSSMEYLNKFLKQLRKSKKYKEENRERLTESRTFDLETIIK